MQVMFVVLKKKLKLFISPMASFVKKSSLTATILNFRFLVKKNYQIVCDWTANRQNRPWKSMVLTKCIWLYFYVHVLSLLHSELVIIIEYYMTFFILPLLSARDHDIGPRDDISWALMTRAIWKKSCINLLITCFARADNMLLPS